MLRTPLPNFEKRDMRLFWILTLVIRAVFVTDTAVVAVPSDFQAWGLVASNISLDPSRRYHLYLEAQPRMADSLERVSTLQLRSAITYSFRPSWLVEGGHAWTPIFMNADYHRIYRDEHRLWQGLSFSHQISQVRWRHRLRQEQRFIEGASEVAHRSRYQLRLSIPLTEDGNFGITGFDEVMVHLNSVEQGPRGGYDRNRVFIGPFWRFGDTRYECGYLGEHVQRVGDSERWNNVLMVAAVASF